MDLYVGGETPPVHGVSPQSASGDDEPAIGATDDGFVYLRQNLYETLEGDVLADVEYAYLARNGTIVRPMSKLTDNSATNPPVTDRHPAVSVGADGRAGVLWVHTARRIEGSGDLSSNQNVYFAILDADGGDLVYGPTSVTHNALWNPGQVDNVPLYNRPRLTATRDGRFVMAWEVTYSVNGGALDVLDVEYAVRGANGAEVHAPALLTADLPGNADGYHHPTVAGFDGDRALVAWVADGDHLPHLVIVDTTGAVRAGPLAVSDPATVATFMDAVAIASDRILLAWASYESSICTVILDAGGNAVTGVANVRGGQSAINLSVTTDDRGRGILTWDDGTRVWYGLIDGVTGSVLLDGVPLLACPGGWLAAGPGGYSSAPYERTYPCERITELQIAAPPGAQPDIPVVLRATVGPDWVSTPISYTWSPAPGAGRARRSSPTPGALPARSSSPSRSRTAPASP